MVKKSKLYFVLVAVAIVFVVGFLSKSKLDEFISDKMKENAGQDVVVSVEQQIEQKYNYSKNSEDYDFTFLEFSSTDCSECEKMEPVLAAIKNSEEVNVNVVFMHIMKPENQEWMKYYGISAVPLQVLLDREGKEFFRHYGYISTEDLLAQFKVGKTL